MHALVNVAAFLASLIGWGTSPRAIWWYSLWSGIVGDLTIVAIPVTYYWHHTCHERGCWRIGHPHEGRVACRRHYQSVHGARR